MLEFDFARRFDRADSVVIAFIVATAIGSERQYRQRSAGSARQGDGNGKPPLLAATQRCRTWSPVGEGAA